MHSKQALFSSLLFILILSSFARSEEGNQATSFTLQVAAFPDQAMADEFIKKLVEAGEKPIWGTIKLPNRGTWIRVFIGTFDAFQQARRYGDDLKARGLIKEFLIKPATEIKALSRARRFTPKRTLRYFTSQIIAPVRPVSGERVRAATLSSSANHVSDRLKPFVLGSGPRAAVAFATGPAAVEISTRLSLPVIGRPDLALAPARDATLLPRPDPVRLAFRTVTAHGRSKNASGQRGGLWISGDRGEALLRLRWIAGEENAALVSLDEDGKVRLDTVKMVGSVGISNVDSVGAPLALLNYIHSNEGLLLLIQVAEGAKRYHLHIGPLAPTFAGEVAIAGSINLDNNFDSRINPYRQSGKKLDMERPSEGMDCLVAINPVARWFNLRMNRLVPLGHITFHELAEAHAKVELGFEYLGQGTRPGAHNIALERERRLEAQRPSSGIVVTVGSNRVLRSESELRRFYEEQGQASGNQR